MKRMSVFAAMILLALSTAAQASDAIRNWAAPSSWTPPSAQAASRSALVTYPPLPFVPLDPCRLIDTRSGSGFPAGYGPPSMGGGGTQRTFTITGQCGVPAGAQAVSFNFAVWVPPTRGDLRVFPAGGVTPTVSTLNWEAGILALANAAVVPIGAGGAITVQIDGPGTVDIFVDINGYYGSNVGPSTFAVSSSSYFGVYSVSSAGIGVVGVGPLAGVAGVSTGGAGSFGVEGIGGAGIGVQGTSSSNVGVKGMSGNNNGLWGESASQDGLFASGGRDGAFIQGARHGVLGSSTGATGILFGVNGASTSTTSGSAGVWGTDATGAPVNWDTITPAGVIGVSQLNSAVLGVTQFGTGIGVRAVRLETISPFPVISEARLAWASGGAALFFGDVSVSAIAAGGGAGNLSVAGNLSKGTGTFKIDHPLDPENKYLYHSFVESPDMMNIYNGIVELDALGEAIVQMPAYFEALNSDFRYQLTSVGRPQANLYIADEVQDLKFRIAGGKPHARVSWQVTGIRKDPLANLNRVIPEIEKEPEAKGYYLHPAAYKQPAEKDLTNKLIKTREARGGRAGVEGQLQIGSPPLDLQRTFLGRGKPRPFLLHAVDSTVMAARTLGRLFLLLSIGVVTGAWSCRQARLAFRGRPPVILISVDTLRADMLPTYGRRDVETPAIDALRRDGILFTRAFSHVPLTLPSHLTMFTGRLPFEHGVRDNAGYGLAPGIRTLAEELKADGYATGAAVSSFVLARGTGAERGFDFFEDRFDPPSRWASTGEIQRPGAATEALLEKWLEGVADRPFFAFLHLYEPHSPYDPPEPFKTRYAASPYLGEIAAADDVLGRFVSFAKSKGVYDKALILFVSDHGEGLGEHGEPEHGVLLYREALQVPLIVKLPGGIRAGASDERGVGLSDVFSTVLAAVRDAAPERPNAKDLLAPGGTAPASSRRIYAETLYPRLHLGWSELASLTDGRWHYIEAPQPEIYDMNADPAERADLAPNAPDAFRALRVAMSGYDRAFKPASAQDAERRARLASLGYLSAAPAASGSLADPKDRIGEFASIHRALALVGQERDREAIPLLRPLLDANPGFIDLWHAYAVALSRVGRLDEALDAGRTGLRMAPSDSPNLAHLVAELYLRKGNTAEAMKHALLARSMGESRADFLLPEIFLAQGDVAKAEEAAREAMRRSSFLVNPRLILAHVLAAKNDGAGALAELDEVGRLLAASRGRVPASYHLLRGQVLLGLGRTAEAIAEIEEERRLSPEEPGAGLCAREALRASGPTGRRARRDRRSTQEEDARLRGPAALHDRARGGWRRRRRPCPPQARPEDVSRRREVPVCSLGPEPVRFLVYVAQGTQSRRELFVLPSLLRREGLGWGNGFLRRSLRRDGGRTFYRLARLNGGNGERVQVRTAGRCDPGPDPDRVGEPDRAGHLAWAVRGPQREPVWPDEQRDVISLRQVDAALGHAVSEETVFSEGFSVIGRNDDDRVLQEAGARQNLECPAKLVVKVPDLGVVELAKEPQRGGGKAVGVVPLGKALAFPRLVSQIRPAAARIAVDREFPREAGGGGREGSGRHVRVVRLHKVQEDESRSLRHSARSEKSLQPDIHFLGRAEELSQVRVLAGHVLPRARTVKKDPLEKLLGNGGGRDIGRRNECLKGSHAGQGAGVYSGVRREPDGVIAGVVEL